MATVRFEYASRVYVAGQRPAVDRLSLELYAFGGERFHAGYCSPKQGSGKQSIHAVGGNAKVHNLVIRELASAWETR